MYTPTRLALLPAAAADSRIPLSRVISASEALAALAMVGGLVLGGALDGVSWDQARLGSLQERGLPVTVAAVLLLNLCGFLTAIPAVFPSDVRRPEAPRSALAGFFKDGRRLARHPGTRSSLLAIAFLRGLVTVAAGAFIADGLARGVGPSSLIAIALACMVGAGIGSLLAGLPNDPRRGLGLVPLGATGLTLALLGAAWFSPVPLWLCAVVGAFSGLVNVPLLAIYQANTPADARGNAMAILNSAGYVVMTGMSLLMAGLAAARLVTTSGQVLLVVLLAMLAAVLAWRALGREGLEQVSGPWLRLRRHRLGERPDHRALTSKSPE